MFFHKPEISICIPVFNTGNTLKTCLESVRNLKIPDGFKAKSFLEVIIVDDGSSDVSLISTIVTDFSKSVKFEVTFLKHSENKGLLEARRTAIYEAQGKYILILDSDDSLTEDAVLNLYGTAVSSGADIVQGITTCKDEKYSKKLNLIFAGVLENNEIINGYLINQNHNGFLWGKLFTREIYLNALNHIPSIYNTFAEDFLQYFWISYEAKKYVGITEKVYNYSIGTGISTTKQITDLEKWEKVCSTASVFTALFNEIESSNIELTAEQKDKIAIQCRSYLLDNIKQLEQKVSPDIRPAAYEMLCDYWGKDFVEKIEEIHKKQENTLVDGINKL